MTERLRWPAALPRPIFQSQSLTPDFGLETMEMESGWSEERRRYTHVPGVYPFSLRLTAVQQDVLLAFAQKVMGTSFEVDLWMPGMSREGCQTFACRFISLTQSGELTTGVWRWNISLRIVSLNIPDFDTLAVLAAYGDDALLFVGLMDVLVNETLPDNIGAP